MTHVVMTLQKLLLKGADNFQGLYDLHSEDLGQSWTGAERAVFHRRPAGGRTEVHVCDLVPQWHADSGQLLAIGQTVYYGPDRPGPMRVRPRATIHTLYDPERETWTDWQRLTMPDEPRFRNAGAGSGQRVDLVDGSILLPVYFKKPEDDQHQATVLHCRFDGRGLEYLKHGDIFSEPVSVEDEAETLHTGFVEPSLTHYQNRYYLTLRNRQHGYVTAGDDGLRFEKPRPWTFDDGKDLGNYNTQQHWITHSDGLFLAYTRRGAGNDHVFRHRAPLFIAEVDPDRLQVIRSTERVLVPEKGARLGNFGVTAVSPEETWITVAEWMTMGGGSGPTRSADYGSDNRIWVARLKWNRSNRLAPVASPGQATEDGTSDA